MAASADCYDDSHEGDRIDVASPPPHDDGVQNRATFSPNDGPTGTSHVAPAASVKSSSPANTLVGRHGGTSGTVKAMGSASAASERHQTDDVEGVGVSSGGSGDVERDAGSTIPTVSRSTGATPGSGPSSEALPSSSLPASGRGWRSPRALSRRVARFVRGPVPPVRLVIRHYPWWPMARVEQTWIRWTQRVAWRDPRDHPASAHLDEKVGEGRQASDDGSLPRGLDEKGSLNSHGGRTTLRERDDVEDGAGATRQGGTTWWHGVRADVRLNWLHWLLLVVVYVAWVLGFAYFVKSLWYQASVTTSTAQDSGGTVFTAKSPPFYSCTDTYASANAGCGLDASSCAPLSSNLTAPFRCPAGCLSTTLGGARAVGGELPAWSPFVVGGGPALSSTHPGSPANRSLYRGDSWICQAAVHAGVIDERRGGCGSVWVAGTSSNFTNSSSHGVDSIGFSNLYPISFFFDDSASASHCTDDREGGYALDVVFLAFVTLVLRPKPIVLFYTLVCAGFWHVNLLSEPRQYPPTVGGPAGDFLPALFVAYALWRVCVRYVWAAFGHAPLEFGVGTMGLYWIGVMLDIVFANVPLQRLVLSDIQSQPGALTSLIIIIVVVVILALNQVRVIRKVGALPKYLCLAVVGGVIVGLLAAVPTTGLRLHHYIIALVLLPFCSFETRLSMLYTAFLLGMFLNGVGRWGFDGVIQDVATIVGSGVSGSALPVLTLAAQWRGVVGYSAKATDETSGLIRWQPVPTSLAGSYDSFQLLVDDVLRYEGSATSFNISDLAAQSLSNANTTFLDNNPWVGLNGSSTADERAKAAFAASPHYVRLAYVRGGVAGDFTRAGTVWFNGTALDPERGAT